MGTTNPTFFSATFGVTICGLFAGLAIKVTMTGLAYRLTADSSLDPSFTDFNNFPPTDIFCSVTEGAPSCTSTYDGCNTLLNLPAETYDFQYTFTLTNIGDPCIIDPLSATNLILTTNFSNPITLQANTTSSPIVGHTDTPITIVPGSNTLPNVMLSITTTTA